MSAAELDDRGVIVSCPHCGQRNRLPYGRLDHLPRCAKCHQELRLPSEPIAVENAADFEALVKGSVLPVLTDFWAAWCGPCKMIAPEIAKVAALGLGRWVVVKVDTELLPDLARRFSVSSIPLLALFKGGREIARQAGAMPAEALRRFVEGHL